MVKKQALQAPKGMSDILPADQVYWDFIFSKAKELLSWYGFDKIDTPIVESTWLFTNSVGRGTDIVDKEIYNFKTKGGDELSLRPECTASVARAYIEHGLQVTPHPVQMWYFGPMFRHDNPQYGRYRQFHQLGIESFGDESAAADATIIFIGYKLLEMLGLKNIVVHVNSIGDNACRPQYIKALKDYYRTRVKKICPKCKERVKTNILRVLDCNEQLCKDAVKEAPQIVDYLDEECKRHFRLVMESLEETGVNYVLQPRLVRGLDYYSRTVFEMWPEENTENPNAIQLGILQGGRYDGLVHTLGGPKTPATGWGMGVERVILLMKEQNVVVPDTRIQPKIFIGQLGELAKRKSLILFEEFRKVGIPAKASFGRDSIKSQLRIANRYGINYTLIMGQKEALDGSVIIREMDSGVQETVPLEKVVGIIQKRLSENPTRRPKPIQDDEEL